MYLWTRSYTAYIKTTTSCRVTDQVCVKTVEKHVTLSSSWQANRLNQQTQQSHIRRWWRS